MNHNSRRLRNWSIFVVVWISVNVVVIQWCKSLERRSLEEAYGLKPGITQKFQERFLTLRTGEKSNDSIEVGYRIFVPSIRKVTGERLPVVLFLHGAGQRSRDNFQQLLGFPTLLSREEMVEKFPCLIVAPQCPAGMDWSRFGNFGGKDALGENILIAILDQVLSEEVADSERVYLVGFSMGSFGAWELAAKYSQRFAAVVPISGGASAALAPQLLDSPIWTVHGDDDAAVPVESTRRIVHAIEELGGSVRYSELEGVGHAAWIPAFAESDEILTWLFQQRRR